eukprot:TRINITY_DN16092_c0_g1_i1.p1 TRINITY_DN16092_c0_g1~~TRINITY_DN16092_c0_g1_i1.p1  ORF type:complete len:306 (-),score=32.88 TRINITY_DN16092_c0_g1_i1:28-945(-)
MSETKLLVCGLGGGLDIINASLLYFAAKSEGKPCLLGSSRPGPIKQVKNHKPFHTHGTVLNGLSEIYCQGRYCEHIVTKVLGENTLFFSRHNEGGSKYYDPKYLREAFLESIKEFGFTHIIFVDGGGDSLILKENDWPKCDPFSGGDSQVLSSIENIPNIYHAVISVGLDIIPQEFQNNLKLIASKGGYYGRINLKTLEKENWKMDHIFQFNDNKFLDKYFQFVEKLVVVKPEDLKNKLKTKSHTATVTYHALKGNYGPQNTFVPWGVNFPSGVKGADVKPDHCWMYFFNPTIVEQVKRRLNEKH